MKEQKKELRHNIKQKIKQLTAEEKEKQAKMVFTRLKGLPQFRFAETVMAFWSMDDEIPTHSFIEEISGSKRVFLPVIKDDDIAIKPYISTEEMQPEMRFNIFEPTGDEVPNINPDLIIVPGLAFDANCNRLGRGKGYYDRFLSSIEVASGLVGICFNEQIVDRVPVDEHDYKVDSVITADGLYLSEKPCQ